MNTMAFVALPCTNDGYPHCRTRAVIVLHLLIEVDLARHWYSPKRAVAGLEMATID